MGWRHPIEPLVERAICRPAEPRPWGSWISENPLDRRVRQGQDRIWVCDSRPVGRGGWHRMATYEYRCLQCGVIEGDLTLARAPASMTLCDRGLEARGGYSYSPPVGPHDEVRRPGSGVRGNGRDQPKGSPPTSHPEIGSHPLRESTRDRPPAGPQDRIINTTTGGAYG